MRLTRIYQPQRLSEGETLDLPKEVSHHLVCVLRLPVGSEFILFNGKGGEFKAKIVSLHKTIASVQVGERNAINRESPVQTVLAQTLLRPEKMDYTLQKAVELGVTHIVPLFTERSSLFKLSPERWQKRLAHWQAILISACEQSGRTQIPTVVSAVPFRTAITEIQADLRVILMPNVTNTLPQLSKLCHRVAVFVGPEGGWSETEIKLATDASCLPLPLGPRILRTETAGLVALTLLQAVWGDISLNLV